MMKVLCVAGLVFIIYLFLPWKTLKMYRRKKLDSVSFLGNLKNYTVNEIISICYTLCLLINL